MLQIVAFIAFIAGASAGLLIGVIIAKQ